MFLLQSKLYNSTNVAATIRAVGVTFMFIGSVKVHESWKKRIQLELPMKRFPPLSGNLSCYNNSNTVQWSVRNLQQTFETTKRKIIRPLAIFYILSNLYDIIRTEMSRNKEKSYFYPMKFSSAVDLRWQKARLCWYVANLYNFEVQCRTPRI